MNTRFPLESKVLYWKYKFLKSLFDKNSSYIKNNCFISPVRFSGNHGTFSHSLSIFYYFSYVHYLYY